MSTATEHGFEIETETASYRVLQVVGCPDTWAVTTCGYQSAVIGGFTCAIDDPAVLEEEALEVIHEAVDRDQL